MIIKLLRFWIKSLIMNLLLFRAGSLNQGTATATASSEPILKTANLMAIFKRKMAVVSRNFWETSTGSVVVVIYH